MKGSIGKEQLLYGTIGFILGIFIAVIIAAVAVNSHNNSMMKMMGMHTNGQGYNMDTGSKGMNMNMGSQ